MDITELQIELKLNKKYIYLFNIIIHFSKYGMSYILKNEEAAKLFEKLKIALVFNRFLF